MKKVFVKPSSESLCVFDDAGLRIPAEGREVMKSTFINRSIKSGALVIVEEEKEQVAEPENLPVKRRKKG